MTKTGWLGIRIMCRGGSTCLSLDCCFSELALLNKTTQCVGLVQSGPYHHLIERTYSRHDMHCIAENCWVGVKQHSLTPRNHCVSPYTRNWWWCTVDCDWCTVNCYSWDDQQNRSHMFFHIFTIIMSFLEKKKIPEILSRFPLRSVFVACLFIFVVCYCQNGWRRKHGKLSLCNKWGHYWLH